MPGTGRSNSGFGPVRPLPQLGFGFPVGMTMEAKRKRFILAVGASVAGLGMALLWMMAPDYPDRRGGLVLSRLEKTVDPEELRNWALNYLTNNTTDVDMEIRLPPVLESNKLGLGVPRVLLDVETGCQFMVLRRFGVPYWEAIKIGDTNARVGKGGVIVKWRDGIYYVRKTMPGQR